MYHLLIRYACLLLLTVLVSCKKDKDNGPAVTVYEAAGDIAPKLAEFKAALGPLNTTPGATGGHRQINWDGVPDAALDKPLAKNFFNPVGPGASVTLQRGLLYGDGDFEVSAAKFSHLNSQASAEFQPFSGTRVFANTTELAWPVTFQVAGEARAASVTAFGMVFSDVDVQGSTTLEAFDGDKSLGKFAVPAHDASSSFSFLGLRFKNAKVTRVKVAHQGRLADGGKDITQGGTIDLIVMDDVVYSEPVAL